MLIDPFYADGPNLYGTILTDPARVAATIPGNRRRHMFDLPLRSSGAPTPGVLAQMRDAITRRRRPSTLTPGLTEPPAA